MQVGVACVRGQITTHGCQQCRCDPLHPCMLSADILQELDPDPNHRHNDPDIFSATGLLGCFRQTVLKQEHPYYVDVEQAWSALRGSMVHALLEKSGGYRPYPGGKQYWREVELEVEVATKYGPQRFVSQPDLIVELHTITESFVNGATVHVKIVDYKSTNEIYHDLTAAKRDHVRQINMYAWLVRRALQDTILSPTGFQLHVCVDELEIFYCDMKKCRRFTSAGYLPAKGKMLTRSPRTYEELILEPIRIFPDEVIDAWITSAIERKIESRTKLAPILGEDDNWLCNYCPVKQVCDELAERGI